MREVTGTIVVTANFSDMSLREIERLVQVLAKSLVFLGLWMHLTVLLG